MLTKDDLEDRFDSISFSKPKTYPQMKAWHHFAMHEFKVDIYPIFELMDISKTKILKYSKKINDGLNKKENLEFLEYIGRHSFDIRVILSYFKP